MNSPRSPKRIYLDSAKPEDFVDIQIHDWIEGVGDVSTRYEEQFFRSYGKLLISRMIPARQPPYEMQDAYILTKEKWIELCEHLTIGCTNQKAFLDSLATHTSPPAPEPDGCSFRVAKMDAMYDNGYAEGAKAARERVLDAIDEWINSDDHLSLYKWEVREKIRSLRTQPEPQQEIPSSRKE